MLNLDNKIFDELNHVTSFRIAAVMNKMLIGVHIKFAMTDGTNRLSYWTVKNILSLYKCLEFFTMTHYKNSQMKSITEDSTYANNFGKNHPINAMNLTKPQFEVNDYKVSLDDFSVKTLQFLDQNEKCALHLIMTSGKKRIDVLDEYTAMNLFGFLNNVINLKNLPK